MITDLEPYKRNFIEFLLQNNALKLKGDFTLISGRVSPYFANIGDFNNGNSTDTLGRAYAQTILATGIDFDLLLNNL